jgi:ribosomal protein S27AE
VVEFVWLGVLLMVPLVYVVMAALSVQGAAFAETAAAREAVGERRAEQAVALVMRDHGVPWLPSGRVISCGACDYAPGSTFTVDLRRTVRLPFVPSWLCGRRCVAGVVVSAHHRDRLDCFAGGSTATESPPC